MTVEEFLNTSYTAYHAVENAGKILTAAGFRRVDAECLPEIERGCGYYAVYGGSSLFAFKVGGNTDGGFAVAESHTDSPSIKIKGEKTQGGEYVRLNAEKYGGGIWNTFFDRPMVIAGRLICEENGKLVPRVVTSDFHVTVPSLAAHFTSGSEETKFQSMLQPLYSRGGSDFISAISKGARVVDFDLFAAVCQQPYLAGAENEFICSPRIDNLTSVYSSVTAIADANPHGVAVCALFDSEEIGSGTPQGAASVVFPRLLKAISDKLGGAEFGKRIADSFALSIDNGHSFHPAHPEKSDPLERVYMNGGIVVKRHVNYATDGMSAAIVRTIAQKAGIPCQNYFHNSDLRCGSTLGLISAKGLAMRCCDVGIAQLAMHSAVEIAGRKDIDRMTKLVGEFYATGIQTAADGIVRLNAAD